MYSAQVLDHFQNPRYVGDLDNPTVSVEATNPACGDVLRLSLRIDNHRVTDVRFRAKGCVPAIACGSKLAELLYGRDLAYDPITREALVASLGQLPPASEHASHLAMDALTLALNQLAKAAAR